ncbi:hypothetical protein BC831DRAFT_4626 [Entophlyctis helioformis]|nr:hypothetical protein BC831DRAFT_4626 [Entophlyctis helioformis]
MNRYRRSLVPRYDIPAEIAQLVLDVAVTLGLVYSVSVFSRMVASGRMGASVRHLLICNVCVFCTQVLLMIQNLAFPADQTLRSITTVAVGVFSLYYFVQTIETVALFVMLWNHKLGPLFRCIKIASIVLHFSAMGPLYFSRIAPTLSGSWMVKHIKYGRLVWYVYLVSIYHTLSVFLSWRVFTALLQKQGSVRVQAILRRKYITILASLLFVAIVDTVGIVLAMFVTVSGTPDSIEYRTTVALANMGPSMAALHVAMSAYYMQMLKEMVFEAQQDTGSTGLSKHRHAADGNGRDSKDLMQDSPQQQQQQQQQQQPAALETACATGRARPS